MNTFAGIDIGGTTVKLGLVRETGKIVARSAFETQTLHNRSAFLEQTVWHLSQLLLQHNPGMLAGIGIGAPGHSLDNRIMVGAVNLAFRDDIPIADHLEQQFAVPVRLIKDAKAAALGELRWGNGKDKNDMVLLMLGTGLGYAACTNRKVINGFQGLAGELGHITFVKNGRQCNCGKQGCLEAYLSATGLKRTAFEILANDIRESSLRDYTFNQLNTKIIAREAQQGDPIAKQAFEQTGTYLGIQLANLTEQLCPETFILAGGLANAGDLLLQPAKAAMEEMLQPIYRNRIELQLSGLGPSDVGILGAAALVMDQIIIHQ